LPRRSAGSFASPTASRLSSKKHMAPKHQRSLNSWFRNGSRLASASSPYPEGILNSSKAVSRQPASPPANRTSAAVIFFAPAYGSSFSRTSTWPAHSATPVHHLSRCISVPAVQELVRDRSDGKVFLLGITVLATGKKTTRSAAPFIVFSLKRRLLLLSTRPTRAENSVPCAPLSKA